MLHDYMTAGAGRLTVLTTGSSWAYIADDRLLHRSHRGQATGLGSGTGTREPGKTQSTKGFITFPSSKYRRHVPVGAPRFHGLTASAARSLILLIVAN